MTRWLTVSIALTVAAFAASLYVWGFHYDQLPEQMATHWNIRGEPDQWMPRDQAFRLNFLLVPAMMAGMVVLTLVLPWLSPVKFKIEPWKDTYYYIMALIVALFGYIHLCLMLSSLLPGRNFIYFLVSGMLLFFALLGNVMGRVRRNFWVGVRTPWTLASDAVWERTHRVAAWLWVGFGLVGAAAVLLVRREEVLIGAFVVLMVVAFAPVLYSLVLYKRLEKQGRLGTNDQ
jgi:uncharacterized membrane protein